MNDVTLKRTMEYDSNGLNYTVSLAQAFVLTSN